MGSKFWVEVRVEEVLWKRLTRSDSSKEDLSSKSRRVTLFIFNPNKFTNSDYSTPTSVTESDLRLDVLVVERVYKEHL